jgi:hypothetical protein
MPLAAIVDMQREFVAIAGLIDNLSGEAGAEHHSQGDAQRLRGEKRI